MNIDGCRRRRGQPGRGRPKFRCDGNIGPPCIVKRGDTVYMDVEFGSGIVQSLPQQKRVNRWSKIRQEQDKIRSFEFKKDIKAYKNINT